MSRVRLVVGVVSMVAVVFGSAAVGLAAWPMTPMRSAPKAASMVFVPRDEVVQIGRRVDVAFPESAIASGLADALVDVEVQIDATGSVTSARAATITVHGGERATTSVSVPSDIDDMVAATVESMNGWRFRAPEVAPAKLIVGIRFAAETRQAIVTRISAPAGYRTKPILQAGGRIKAPTKIYNVQPVYPQEAMDQMVQGVVTLDVVVAEDGSVKELSVSRSVPQLDAAAIDAVKQWRYEPTLLNGAAVPIRLTATVSFTLGQQ